MLLETLTGPLYYDITDLTPPWLEQPETIVFCHGVATNCDIWAGWLPILAPHFRIVRFDTRGFGRSLEYGENFSWSMDALADDIVAVASAADAERFHLIEESVGGTASLHLASRRFTRAFPVLRINRAPRRDDSPRARVARVRCDGEDGRVVQMMERRFSPAPWRTRCGSGSTRYRHRPGRARCLMRAICWCIPIFPANLHALRRRLYCWRRIRVRSYRSILRMKSIS